MLSNGVNGTNGAQLPVEPVEPVNDGILSDDDFEKFCIICGGAFSAGYFTNMTVTVGGVIFADCHMRNIVSARHLGIKSILVPKEIGRPIANALKGDPAAIELLIAALVRSNKKVFIGWMGTTRVDGIPAAAVADFPALHIASEMSTIEVGLFLSEWGNCIERYIQSLQVEDEIRTVESGDKPEEAGDDPNVTPGSMRLQ